MSGGRYPTDCLPLAVPNMNQDRSSVRPSTAVPFWRDIRVLGILAQVAFVVVIVVSLGWVGNNVSQGLKALGGAQFLCDDGTSSFRCAFNFMSTAASFDIGEKVIDYSTTDSYWRALAIGVLNTIKVAVVGIILTTLLGVLAGIAVLSNNWLLSRIAIVYIDIIRNTPLLVQLFFLYFAVILQLPPLKDSLRPGLGIYLNQRGITLPWPAFTASFPLWLAFVFLGLIQFQLFFLILNRQPGKPTNRWLWPVVSGAVVIAVGWYYAVNFNSSQAVLTSRASRVAQATDVLTGLEALVIKRLPVTKLTPAELEKVDAETLAEAALTVCVLKASPSEPNFVSQIESRNIPFRIERFDRPDQAVADYAEGECEVIVGDRVMLAAERAVLENADTHLLTPIAEYPVVISLPRLEGLNLVGGVKLTPEFAAILFGLVLYTGAFIAEIVRAGILSVPRGQSEAARALGLTETQRLRLVVLPQALRVIIPPLTSQYLNLTKNSSLAIAVAYPDLVAVTNTIINQSGRSMQVIALIMLSYLTVSLSISALLNWYNRRVVIVER
ncbi:MAG TPA: ABC transporter permease subunit [Anaerolineales bacterium]|nr:ABC transporter permease subunit [Anaerolineales bacterium]